MRLWHSLVAVFLVGCAMGDIVHALSPHASCAGAGGDSRPPSPAPKGGKTTNTPGAPATPIVLGVTSPPAPPQAPHAADLMVYTATLVMAVYQVEPNLDAVERVARETGGYLSQRGD